MPESMNCALWFVVIPYNVTSSLAHNMIIMPLNTSRLEQNGRRFADDIFKCIFLNENISILIKISLKFVPKGPIN